MSYSTTTNPIPLASEYAESLVFAHTPVTRSIQQMLMATLIRLERSPDLSPEEIEWVRRLAVRLMTDVTVAQSDRTDEPIAA